MRLIDADALWMDVIHSMDYCDDILEMIESQPTIEPEPHWIPVSEKLPEEGDYKSCIECLDGAVWYFTENGTMGLGYYYKSTKEWSTTADLKTDGRVLAWMSLPETYNERMISYEG